MRKDEAANPGPTSAAPPQQGLRRWLIGTDPEQAAKRIRWGGIAGIAAALVNFIVALVTYYGDDSVAGVIRPGGWPFLFVLAEAAVYAALAVAVLRKNRTAAALLLGYHLASKLILFGLAAFGLGPGTLRAIPFHLAFAYLFFQGMRGAFTWHYLTHPVYPPYRPPQEVPPENDGAPE